MVASARPLVRACRRAQRARSSVGAMGISGLGHLNCHYPENLAKGSRKNDEMWLYSVESTARIVRHEASDTDQRLLSALRENAPRLHRRDRPQAGLLAQHGAGRSNGSNARRDRRLHRARARGGRTRPYPAHIMVTVLPRQMAAVVEALRAMPEVRALHSVSGPFDLARSAWCRRSPTWTSSH